MKAKADIGLIGLAVMGENLVLNMERNGYTVAVYNRTVDKVDKFIKGRGKNKKFIGALKIKCGKEPIEDLIVLHDLRICYQGKKGHDRCNACDFDKARDSHSSKKQIKTLTFNTGQKV